MDSLGITGYGQTWQVDSRQQMMPSQLRSVYAGEGTAAATKDASGTQSSGSSSSTAAVIRLPEDRVDLSGVKPEDLPAYPVKSDEKSAGNTENSQPGQTGQGQSVTDSQTGKAAAASTDAQTNSSDASSQAGQDLKELPGQKKEPKPGEKTTADGKSLEDPQVKQQISEMKANEEKVKAHEAAHKAVGGSLASSATYSYSQGPDGHRYITGGEVQIDMSSGKTPEETISRMQQVIRAAMAPAEPSPQDRAVAAQAGSMLAQAQQEKSKQSDPTRESQPGDDTDPVKEATKKANSADARIKNAYNNPAVRGEQPASGLAARPDSYPATGSQLPFSDSRRSAISSFA